MTEIRSVVNYPVVTTKPSVNFKAVSAMPNHQQEVDTFIKQQEKEQKAAKRKQNLMYGLQAGAMLAIIASIYFMAKSSQGMGKKTSELKEIWSDLGNSAKVEDLALPKGLTDFLSKFKKSL